jgi:3-hydroxyisobutyrate dehydrogenase
MRVAFLGLGAIGEPMARHLARDPFELRVWNRTREKADAFAQGSAAKSASTPVEAVGDAEFIVTCLPSSREVEEVVTGFEGSLQAGALLIDCTSGDPAASRRIAGRLGSRGIGFIDAPVSGGVKGAVAGTLTVMCGGEAADIQRARPVLDTFGGKVVHCGKVGTGHAVKAMNQAMLAVHIWSLGEALVSLAKLGVETGVALDVINGSSGRSNSSENLFTERVIGRAFPRTFRLALLDKDVGIAADIAREEEVPSPFIELAARLFSQAHAELGEEADHVEALKFIEARAGVTLG